MNKLYTLKSLVLAAAFFAFTGIVSAQSFTLDPGNSVTEVIPANGFIEPKIDATNNLSTNLTLDYRLVSNTMDSAWSILVCDNVNCYSNAVGSGTMDPIAPTVKELIFKITLNPNNVAGSGSIAYAVWDQNDVNSRDTVTFNFEVTPAVSIEEEQLAAQVKLYPQPASELLNIALPESFGRGDVQVFDLSGAVVARQEIAGTSADLDVSPLAAGMYILRVSNDKAVINKRISIQ